MLNRDKIEEILSEEKPNQKEQVKFTVDKIRSYFPKGYTIDQMQKIMQKLLEEYHARWQRKIQARESR